MKPMILMPFLLATAAPVLAQSQVDEPTPAGAQAQASPAFAPPVWGFEGSDVPVDPGYTYGALPNGMRYILRENHQPRWKNAKRNAGSPITSSTWPSTGRKRCPRAR
jgi:zinc protease